MLEIVVEVRRDAQSHFSVNILLAYLKRLGHVYQKHRRQLGHMVVKESGNQDRNVTLYTCDQRTERVNVVKRFVKKNKKNGYKFGLTRVIQTDLDSFAISLCMEIKWSRKTLLGYLMFD